MNAYQSVSSFVILSSHSPFHHSHLQFDFLVFYPCCANLVFLFLQILKNPPVQLVALLPHCLILGCSQQQQQQQQ